MGLIVNLIAVKIALMELLNIVVNYTVYLIIFNQNC